MHRRRARRFGRLLAGAGFASLGAACSLLTSLDGLTGAGGDGGPPEAGAVDASVPTADTGGSVPPPDATGGDDAAEGGDDGAGETGDDGPVDAATSFCASLSSQPAFCDDFDEDVADAAALTAPWDQVTGLGGSVTRDGALFTSSPLAMLVTTTAAAPGFDLCGYKAFKKAKLTGQFSLAFDLYVEKADTTTSSDAVLSAVEFLDAFGSRWALQLETFYNATSGALDVDFSENLSPGDAAPHKYLSHPASQSLPIGAWTRVTMEVSVNNAFGPGATTNIAALHFGTKEVAKPTVLMSTVDGYPEILVGVTYAKTSSEGWIVHIDDVTFTLP